MSAEHNIPGTDEAWENEALGASKEHAALASADLQSAVDESLAMQAISIRLPRSTIELFKALAALEGIGYQPLMREALTRFAASEAKLKVMEFADRQKDIQRQGAETKKAA
ncbi:hypothetical protein D7I39_11070 [Allopusillimonas ginsengisoli]|nr:hypothetical protein D7I39_11070 [Allopusillimonas ginsengisoli]